MSNITGDTLNNPQIKARFLVKEHYNHNLSPGEEEIELRDAKINAFSKVVDNWKAVIVVNRANSPRYEITHKGDKEVIVIDIFRKVDSISIASNLI